MKKGKKHQLTFGLIGENKNIVNRCLKRGKQNSSGMLTRSFHNLVNTDKLFLSFSTVFTQNLHGNQGMLTSMWLDRPHSRMPAAPDRTNVASVAMHKAT
jgi:hypothetical protein